MKKKYVCFPKNLFKIEDSYMEKGVIYNIYSYKNIFVRYHRGKDEIQLALFSKNDRKAEPISNHIYTTDVFNMEKFIESCEDCSKSLA